VQLARTSKFEDAWLYDGKKLVDIGFRENAFLNDPRGDFFTTISYLDIKKNTAGKEKITLYHIHQANPGNATSLITSEDIGVAIRTLARLRKDGISADVEYKVACPGGVYSLKLDDSLIKLYDSKKSDFEDFVMLESTKKEFELMDGRQDRERFFKHASEMSMDDKEEMRKIQLSALGSIGITITFEKHE
jgi:hypothetical protein